MPDIKGPVKTGRRVKVHLSLPAIVKAQLETLAAERGETLSDTVGALVALAWGGDGPGLPRGAVRAALAKARNEARGSWARTAGDAK